jgi:hypothetical protein
MRDVILTGPVTVITTLLTLVGGGIAAALVAGRLSRAVKISEFRQKWIDELRADIASFVGAAHRWIRIYEEYNAISTVADKPKFESEKVRSVQNEAYVILYRIRMRINPRDDSPTKAEDDLFLKSLGDLLNPGKLNPDSFESSWIKLADAVVEQGREILKREWEETKHPAKR